MGGALRNMRHLFPRHAGWNSRHNMEKQAIL